MVENKKGWARTLWEAAENLSHFDSIFRHFFGDFDLTNFFRNKKKTASEEGFGGEAEELNEGGEDDETDERRFAGLLLRLTLQEREQHDGFQPIEFPIHDSDRFTRAKARKHQERYRVFIVGMDVTQRKLGKAKATFEAKNINLDGLGTGNFSREWEEVIFSVPTERALAFLKFGAKIINSARTKEEHRRNNGKVFAKTPDNEAVRRECLLVGYKAYSDFLYNNDFPHMPRADESDFYDNVRRIWESRHVWKTSTKTTVATYSNHVARKRSSEGGLNKVLLKIAKKI